MSANALSKLTMVMAAIALSLTATVQLRAADESAPDEGNMTPTQHGMRVTPAMARSLGRYWVHQHFGELSPTRAQSQRMAELAAQRILNHPLTGGGGGANFVEYMLEAEMSVRPKFGPETGRRFAERHASLIPFMREFEEGFAKDIRPLLEPEQQEALDEWARERRRWNNRFEAKLKRWAEGKAEENEAPFDWKESDLAADPDEAADRSEQVKRADGWTKHSLRWLGPAAWDAFLGRAEDFFGFDTDQKARGNALLADYRRRARAIMTREWRQQVRRNRFLYNLGYLIHGVPLNPWRYHLEQEFEGLIKPLKDLGRGFRNDVLALVTDQQREATFAKLRAFGTEYDLAIETLNVAERRLADLASTTAPAEAESE